MRCIEARQASGDEALYLQMRCQPFNLFNQVQKVNSHALKQEMLKPFTTICN
jgi:hypothetical protein